MKLLGLTLTLDSRDHKPVVLKRVQKSALLSGGRARRLKTGDKNSASRTSLLRDKAQARRARMEEHLQELGDPREEQSLEEKKRMALFYYFSQVQPNSLHM